MAYPWNWVSAQGQKKTTRMMGLPEVEKVMIGLTVYTQYQRVTDGRTDGQVAVTTTALNMLCVARLKHSRFGLAWSRPRADRGLSGPTRLRALATTC